MKKRMHQMITLLLAAVLIGTSLAGCSESEVNSETTADTDSTLGADSTSPESIAETDTMEDSLDAVIAALPDANYDGYSFTQWMTTHQLTSTIFMRQGPDEELTGEPINDALWTRDRAMEDKYNIVMDYNIPTSGLAAEATKVVQSGDDAIGLLYMTMISDAPSFVTNGMAMDMAQIEQIDLTKPYWSQHANKDLAIGGRMFYATGDITTRYAGAPYIILFQKQLLTDRGFALPYDDVIEGTWTFDKLQSMVNGQYQDANGNGKVDANDFYGFAYEKSMQGFAFYNGFGYNAVRFEDETPVICIAEEEHINSIDTLAAFAALQEVWQTEYVYQETEIFEENRAVFVGQTACNLFMLTDMEANFGVLPVPKQNEAQDDYYSYCNLNCATSVHIPKSTKDLERTGTLVEALAAASRVSSMRAQYEITLQYRQTRDEQSVQMLQIASEAATYDPANVYALGGLYATINTCIDDASPIASRLKSMQKVIPKTVEKMLEKIVGE